MFALSNEFIYNHVMEFFRDQILISFGEFSDKFPEEAEVLKDSLELEVKFQIEGQTLKLVSPYSNPVSIDASSRLDYHKKHFYKKSLYKEPLARALGFKKGIDKPYVLDATAGMMGDSILMLAMGARVDICERNPIAAALCANTIKNNKLDIQLYFGSATDFDLKPDVIYFDPMYSQKNDKTKPKKEMQIFRDVVGVDLDAKETATVLLKQSQRLVIKRSIKADPLIDNPSMTISGKSTSYDVYLNQ
tara:strand:+ start:176 stop:916 length:741 start_codon:yes stop_codon:yes gene_type:complete